RRPPGRGAGRAGAGGAAHLPRPRGATPLGLPARRAGPAALTTGAGPPRRRARPVTAGPATGGRWSGTGADPGVAGVLAVGGGGADLPGDTRPAAGGTGPPPADDRDDGHHRADERCHEERRADAHRLGRYRARAPARSSASVPGSTGSAYSGCRATYRATNGQRATMRRPERRTSSSAPRAKRLPRPRPSNR